MKTSRRGERFFAPTSFVRQAGGTAGRMNSCLDLMERRGVISHAVGWQPAKKHSIRLDTRFRGHDESGTGMTKCKIVPSVCHSRLRPGTQSFVLPDLIGNPLCHSRENGNPAGPSFPAPTGNPQDGNAPPFLSGLPRIRWKICTGESKASYRETTYSPTFIADDDITPCKCWR